MNNTILKIKAKEQQYFNKQKKNLWFRAYPVYERMNAVADKFIFWRVTFAVNDTLDFWINKNAAGKLLS